MFNSDLIYMKYNSFIGYLLKVSMYLAFFCWEHKGEWMNKAERGFSYCGTCSWQALLSTLQRKNTWTERHKWRRKANHTIPIPDWVADKCLGHFELLLLYSKSTYIRLDICRSRNISENSLIYTMYII